MIDAGPDALPDPLRIPDARARIRSSREAEGRRTVVLDDDPTGSQCVYGMDVVTALDAAEYARALAEPGATCFVLTNTRSLPEREAVRLTAEVATDVLTTMGPLAAPVDLVSRSDSTLRGHVVAEMQALVDVHLRETGRPVDGVLLVPAFFEAGRFTAGDVHYATVDGVPVPVADTEFARDASFGYTRSNLREFVAEKSGGRLRPDEVVSLTLHDIRVGGPDRVAEILGKVSGGAYVVVNATDYADLEVVVLGLIEARRAGRSFVYRVGPSFMRAIAGIEPRAPLRTGDIWPQGHPGGHGLLVVGSHVGLTSLQVAAAEERGHLERIELSVPALLDPRRRDDHIAETAARVRAALVDSDVLLLTSRDLVRGTGADDSLAIARAVSAGVTSVVRAALPGAPAWVVAKGGITSHDVAVEGLGIRRAEVLGQLLPGMVSVLRPVEAAEGAVGVPYVVFAGNVGDARALAHVVDVVTGRGSSAAAD
ncbi:four-carbon acid sugar kinase family protein [Blastococcus deserti]|uniref:Four-carbon acid sugar kinase family protein n=1 Tax=Blastococcus deserti TaxID=2259033 RepID=A0ABW4X4M7_9ACTN